MDVVQINALFWTQGMITGVRVALEDLMNQKSSDESVQI